MKVLTANRLTDGEAVWLASDAAGSRRSTLPMSSRQGGRRLLEAAGKNALAR